MTCPHCATPRPYVLSQKTALGYHACRCRGCKRTYNERTGTAYKRLEYPTDVVLLVVRWRLQFKLSLRDLVPMFSERGITFTPETVRDWEERFAPLLTERLRAKRRGTAGKRWYVDEM
jgi:transposase-like protein